MLYGYVGLHTLHTQDIPPLHCTISDRLSLLGSDWSWSQRRRGFTKLLLCEVRVHYVIISNMYCVHQSDVAEDKIILYWSILFLRITSKSRVNPLTENQRLITIQARRFMFFRLKRR